MRFLLSSSALAVVMLAASSASAQPSGFALDRFEPSERGSEWFAGDSLDLRGHLRPAAGVVGGYGYKPLVVYEPNGDERGAIVKHQLVTHFGGSLVLWNRLRGGINLPLYVFQQGDVPRATGVRTNDPKTAFGDLRIAADVRIIGEHEDPITLALGVAMWVPTGSRDQYTSDGEVRFAPRVSVAGDIPIAGDIGFTYAARLAFDYRGVTDKIEGRALGSDFTFTAAAGLRLAEKKLVIGPELFGSSVTTPGSFFEKQTTPVEGLLGAHYTFMKDFRVGGGVGTGFTRGWGSPVFRALLSAEWAPAFDKPEPPPPPAPPPPPPPPPPPADRDNDGILDPVDACPDTPGVANEDPKKNGCPPEPPPPPPPPPDRDNDGILDSADACPDVPGPSDPDPKKNGCPLARVEGGQVKITEQVKFKTASAEILPESDLVLRAIADILKGHPEITKIRVEGHTDNKGAAAYNKDLSKKRATSVATWLIRAGIAKDRLVSEGFGLEKPIDDNSTEEGRQNNRRVEFHIVDMKKTDGDAKKPAETPKTQP